MHRRILSVVLIAIFLLLALPCKASATSQEPQYIYELHVDGNAESRQEKGNIVTFSVYLHRTDNQETFNMRGMQTEVRYDTSFFRLIEDSYVTAPGIVAKHVNGVGQFDEMYFNFLSYTGSDIWEAEKFIGSFRLEVLSGSGVSKVTLEDSMVAHPDGLGDSFEYEEVEHTVIVTTECTVKFVTNGGSVVQDMIVIYGEKIPKPQNPVREGYTFAGWYKDIHLQEQWDFDKDVVESSMYLYAKWTPDPTQPTETTEPTDPTQDPGNNQTCDGNRLILIILLIVVILASAFIIFLLLFRRKKNDEEDCTQEDNTQI
ncbi:MAG: InlB B-repeat-containing protein [Oscillospiraceae bacterium]|nr:InlB B-repeat-containing protein [Oscillospiraceae bacterium]